MTANVANSVEHSCKLLEQAHCASMAHRSTSVLQKHFQLTAEILFSQSCVIQSSKTYETEMKGSWHLHHEPGLNTAD